MVIVVVISTPHSGTFGYITSLRIIEIFAWSNNANKPLTGDLAGKRLACEGNLRKEEGKKSEWCAGTPTLRHTTSGSVTVEPHCLIQR